MKKVELMYGNGCKHHPDCFTCPHDECIEGTIHEDKIALARALRKKAHALYQQGKKPKEVMAELGISQVTAYRYRRSMA